MSICFATESQYPNPENVDAIKSSMVSFSFACRTIQVVVHIDTDIFISTMYRGALLEKNHRPHNFTKPHNKNNNINNANIAPMARIKAKNNDKKKTAI